LTGILNFIDWNEEDLVAELVRHYKLILVYCRMGLALSVGEIFPLKRTRCSCATMEIVRPTGCT
jgi:hypothetical protein